MLNEFEHYGRLIRFDSAKELKGGRNGGVINYYLDGVLVFKEQYYDDGAIYKRIPYKDGLKHGQEEHFKSEGGYLRQTYYLEGLISGTDVRYSLFSDTSTTCLYKEGIKQN